MDGPPSKRRVIENDFDDFEFTQQDLQQIDLICSQHVPETITIRPPPKPFFPVRPSSAGSSTPLSTLPPNMTRCAPRLAPSLANRVPSKWCSNGGLLQRTSSLDTERRLVSEDRSVMVTQHEVTIAEELNQGQLNKLKEDNVKLKDELFMTVGELATIKETHAKFSRARMDEIRKLQAELRREREEAKRTVQSLQSQMAFQEADLREVQSSMDLIKKQNAQLIDNGMSCSQPVSVIPVTPSPSRRPRPARTAVGREPGTSGGGEGTSTSSTALAAHENRWRQERAAGNKTLTQQTGDRESGGGDGFPNLLTFLAPTKTPSPTGLQHKRSRMAPHCPIPPTPAARGSPPLSQSFRQESLVITTPSQKGHVVEDNGAIPPTPPSSKKPVSVAAKVELVDVCVGTNESVPSVIVQSHLTLRLTNKCPFPGGRPTLKYVAAKVAMCKEPVFTLHSTNFWEHRAIDSSTLSAYDLAGWSISDQRYPQPSSRSLAKPPISASSQQLYLAGLSSLFSRSLCVESMESRREKRVSSEGFHPDLWVSRLPSRALDLPELDQLGATIRDVVTAYCAELDRRQSCYAAFQKLEPTLSSLNQPSPSPQMGTPMPLSTATPSGTQNTVPLHHTQSSQTPLHMPSHTSRVDVFALAARFPHLDWDPIPLNNATASSGNYGLCLHVRARLALWMAQLLELWDVGQIVVDRMLPVVRQILVSEEAVLMAGLDLLIQILVESVAVKQKEVASRISDCIDVDHLFTAARLSNNVRCSVLQLISIVASKRSSHHFVAQISSHSGSKECVLFGLFEAVAKDVSPMTLIDRARLLKYFSVFVSTSILEGTLIWNKTCECRKMLYSVATQLALPVVNSILNDSGSRYTDDAITAINCLLRTYLCLQAVHGYAEFQLCTDPLPGFFYIITGLTRLIDSEHECPRGLNRALVEELYDFGNEDDSQEALVKSVDRT